MKRTTCITPLGHFFLKDGSDIRLDHESGYGVVWNDPRIIKGDLNEVIHEMFDRHTGELKNGVTWQSVPEAIISATRADYFYEDVYKYLATVDDVYASERTQGFIQRHVKFLRTQITSRLSIPCPQR